MKTTLLSIPESEVASKDLGRGANPSGLVCLANDTRFNQATFSQFLTNYAVGFRDSSDIEAALDFFAPRVIVPKKFEYSVFSNSQEFESETDDARAIGAAFKSIEDGGTKTQARTENRGLTMTVDRDEISEDPMWKERKVAKLMRRLRRNALRRAIALLSAMAVNTNRTWDSTAGKDPDMDITSDLVSAADISGISPNRVGYGPTAWQKRLIAHRAQNNSGGNSSSVLTEAGLAGFLGVDKVYRSTERYQSSASTKTQILANLVIAFMAFDNMDEEDPSNIKRFQSLCNDGAEVAVYVDEIGPKKIDITVEHYEKLATPYTGGVRKSTIS